MCTVSHMPETLDVTSVCLFSGRNCVAYVLFLVRMNVDHMVMCVCGKLNAVRMKEIDDWVEKRSQDKIWQARFVL